MICDLIIPAVNEEENIGPLFDQLDHLRGKVVRHVVLADNGSTDHTAKLARARGATVVHEPQPGYGAACLKAMDWIDQQNPAPDCVAFLDADLADDPAVLTQLLEPLRRSKADLVIGSRTKLAESGALNFPQRFGGWLACMLMWLFTGQRYSDLGPMRAIRWKTLKQLNMTDRTWGWTVEMQMKAAFLSIPVAEIDVPYVRRRHGRSKISGTVLGVIKAGTKIIFTIFLLWWNRRKFSAISGQHSAQISLL